MQLEARSTEIIDPNTIKREKRKHVLLWFPSYKPL